MFTSFSPDGRRLYRPSVGEANLNNPRAGLALRVSQPHGRTYQQVRRQKTANLFEP